MAQPFIRLAGRRIDLTQVDQRLFPEDGIVKQDIITYYRTIARVMLRHIHDRPLTLQRFPDGIDGKERLLSSRPTHFPQWLPGAKAATQDIDTYITASSPADLVYLANQGMVSVYMGLARVDRPQHPDRLVFDLDPMDSGFNKVTQAVNRLRRYLEAMGLTSFVQTTGSRGLHLAVPIKRTLPFEDVREFAETVAGDLAAMFPDVLTTDATGHRNRERVYINCARNAFGQTVIVPYSLRGVAGAPVATPLDWKELSNTDLSPEKYDIRSILRRLAQKSDPWEGMNRRASSLQKAREHLSSAQSGAA